MLSARGETIRQRLVLALVSACVSTLCGLIVAGVFWLLDMKETTDFLLPLLPIGFLLGFVLGLIARAPMRHY